MAVAPTDPPCEQWLTVAGAIIPCVSPPHTPSMLVIFLAISSCDPPYEQLLVGLGQVLGLLVVQCHHGILGVCAIIEAHTMMAHTIHPTSSCLQGWVGAGHLMSS